MAYQVKTAAVKPATTTNTTVYQVTAGKQFVLASLRIINMGSSDEVVQVAFATTSTPGTTEWITKVTVSANKPVQLSGDLLPAATYIVAYNATSNNCIVQISGWEEV